MKAPEKLYVDAEDRLSDSILYGFTEKRKNNDIAYIRNDAFIEKACAYLDSIGHRYLITSFRNYMEGEKVDNANKAESKFHEGDWIISNNKKSTYQVIEVKRGIYVLRDNADNHENHIGIKECEKSGRLWNIIDAKDGDMLACGDKVTDCPFIFHNLTKELNPRSYCGVNTLGHFQDNDENGGFWCNSYEVRPATKEQRDILFAKMKDSGYVWDAKKKELKHDGSE